MLRRGLVALVYLLAVPQWAAAEPTCPEGHDEVFQGTLFRASPTAARAVTMAPCKTLLLTFTGTIVGQPAIGLSVQVMLKNDDGVTLASQSSWCYVIAGCGFTMPLPSGYSGTPLPGTAGSPGRVSTVTVTIGNPR